MLFQSDVSQHAYVRTQPRFGFMFNVNNHTTLRVQTRRLPKKKKKKKLPGGGSSPDGYTLRRTIDNSTASFLNGFLQRLCFGWFLPTVM